MSDIQAQTDVFFVRQEMVEAAPPPTPVRGVWPWMRANLFGSIGDTILTIVGIVVAVAVIVPVLQWSIFNATWTGDNREACAANTIGACWAFVNANFGQFIYGRYPDPERWRVNLAFVLLASALKMFGVGNIALVGTLAAVAAGTGLAWMLLRVAHGLRPLDILERRDDAASL